MKQIIIALLMFLSLTASAQKTVESPTIGARSMGACIGIFIDKIEIKNDVTKLYLTNYHGHQDGWFRISSGTTLRAGDKKWKLLNAEGIDLDTQVFPKDDGKLATHFVLNFPAIDMSLETIDLYEGETLNSIILYDIALTDRSADEINKRNAVPDAVRNYALNIKDNGESLETNSFSMEPAIVKGKIYGFDRRTFGEKMSAEVKVFIFNPFLGEQLSYSGRINTDNTYEIQVPMTTKHQTVYLGANPIISNDIVISAGKTVVVDFDFQQIYKSWELPNNCLIPYFSGENVDINYALSLGMSRSLNQELLNYPTAAEKISKFTMKEYKDYVFDFFEDINNRINVMPVTKRAKEYLRILLKSEEAYYLSMGSFWIENAYRTANGKGYNDSIPEFKKPVIDESYLDYPKTLDLDNVMMFYADKFSYNISYWNGRILYDLNKSAEGAEAFKNEIFGMGDSFFKDFIKLQEYCQPLSDQAVVPDSIIAKIEKMRFPFYADYVKAKNSEIAAKIAEENARGGYYVHQASESTGDSLFVDLIKDFKGKVVFIDFWNTWCVPCRQAFKDLEPMNKEFEGKDVVFLFIADESSPQKVYDRMIVSMKGHHYRLNNAQASSLRQKWGFPGIPSYVIVGRDGIVKDFHTGFKGVDYYRARIERELK